MKKILGISLVAVLAATPLMANAAGSAPTAATTESQPYLGVEIDTTKDTAATASAAYVKGAYNAAIGAVNAVSAAKQDKIDADHKLSAGVVSGLAAVATSGSAADLTQDTTHRLVSDTEKSTWSGKQNALSEAQLAAANSGITAAKVETYDGYATGKQNTLSATNKLDTAYIATGTDAQFVSASEKSTWNAKQNALSEAQLAAANSGITADKRTSYDNLVTASAHYATDTAVENTVETATITASVASQSVSGYVPVMVNWGDQNADNAKVALTGASTAGGSISNVQIQATYAEPQS